VCFDYDSTPPIPIISGGAVSHEDLVLEARDGARFAAFAAVPEEPPEAGVVVLPDVRGLYHFYEELALRFAERGIAAVAIDYFGRTAGIGKRDEGFEYREHADQMTPAGIQADLAAAVAWLRSPAGGSPGGRQSWLAAGGGHGLAGAVGFYGRPGPGQDGSPGPAQRAAELEAPILGLMGGADRAISADDVAEFDQALEAAGVEHELVTYEGAPHSFFDRRQEEFAEASEDAWARVLAFVERYS
jgi:carboxymethylenebutenolidase